MLMAVVHQGYIPLYTYCTEIAPYHFDLNEKRRLSLLLLILRRKKKQGLFSALYARYSGINDTTEYRLQMACLHRKGSTSNYCTYSFVG